MRLTWASNKYSMVVGVGWSGGGITAIMCTICMQSSLDGHTNEIIRTGFANANMATVSGGSLGHALYGSAAERMFIPSYAELVHSNVSYDALTKKGTSTAAPVWFGEVLNYIPYALNLDSLLALLRTLGVLPSIIGKPNWWGLVVADLFKQGYGVDPAAVRFRGNDTFVHFALLAASSCPVSFHDDFTIKPASVANASLASAVFSASAGSVDLYGAGTTGGHTTIAEPIAAIDAIGASSSFWNAGIVSSALGMATLKGWLNAYTITDGATRSMGRTGSMGGAGRTMYSMDGGLTDTTGIVAHLRTRSDAVIAFYNNNDDLHALNATLAYLFGVPTTTNNMNVLEGPNLAQVFPPDLYAEAIANLTNPSLLRARLTNVSVLANAYLGVEAYTLKELLVVSNQYSKVRDVRGGGGSVYVCVCVSISLCLCLCVCVCVCVRGGGSGGGGDATVSFCVTITTLWRKVWV